MRGERRPGVTMTEPMSNTTTRATEAAIRMRSRGDARAFSASEAWGSAR
jgi:hypothetical protein